MQRPYEGKNPNNCIGQSALGAGDFIPGIIPVPDRAMGDEGNAIHTPGNVWRFYLMGWIAYDDAGEPPIRRRMAFCRIYNPKTGRFEAINDPDYEHEG